MQFGRVIGFGILTFVLGCSSEEEGDQSNVPAQSEISAADTLHEAGDLTEAQSNDTTMRIIPRASINELSVRADSFRLGISTQYELLDRTKGHLLDRFENEFIAKYSFAKKQEVPYGEILVVPEAHLSLYKFSNEEKLENVLMNWMECFESDCNQIEIGKEKGPLKTPPAFAVINPSSHEIIYLHYLCEHAGNNWGYFKAQLKLAFAAPDSYGFEIQCGGKIKWFGSLPKVD